MQYSDLERTDNVMVRIFKSVFDAIDKPVTFVKENLIKPHQKTYPWYHQKFRRVPTIAECEYEDGKCIAEAELQFYRDKLVESHILIILRTRYHECVLDHTKKDDLCKEILQQYRDAETAWFTKYGDLGVKRPSYKALMKQKHRMVWERRHGEVGTGMGQAPNSA